MSDSIIINMPDIGEGIAEGEIIKWLKTVHDNVVKNEPVVLVMTDKATIELSAPREGKISKLFYQEGDIAACQTPLYALDLLNQDAIKIEQNDPHSSSENRPPDSKQEKQVLAAPFVRQLAQDLNIDLAQVQGTGKDGAVTEKDVKEFAALSLGSIRSSLPPSSEFIGLKGIQLSMAKKMKESYSQIPHFSYFERVDVSKLVIMKEGIKHELSQKELVVTYMPFFIRALSLLIQKYPFINSWFNYAENQWIIHKHQHIGIAVSTNNGLIVPVLRDVQEMDLLTIIEKYETLKQKSLKGQLAPEEMKKSTITLSNFSILGSGAQWTTPIINSPEVAILAIAKIHKQPFIENEQIVVRDALNLSWSFNHCVIDGEMAALVSYYYNKLISNPKNLL